VPASQIEYPLGNAEMITELKKILKVGCASEEAQTIVELLAHGLVAPDKKLVALLTDLIGFYRFFWFETSGVLKFVKCSQVLTSPTEAHAVIQGLLRNDHTDHLANRCCMPVEQVLTSIPEDSPHNDGDAKRHGEDGAGGGGGGGELGAGASKEDCGGTTEGRSGNTSAGWSGASKVHAYSSADLDDLPGANLLSLIDSDDPRANLVVAREYVRSCLVPRMTGFAELLDA